VRIQRKKRCQFVKGDQQEESDEEILKQVLLERSVVSIADLETAVLEKKRLLRKHLKFHFGEILINLGMVEKDDLLPILREKRGEIRYCNRCDMNFHVSANVSESRWKCSRCGEKLEEVSFFRLIETDGKIM